MEWDFERNKQRDLILDHTTRAALESLALSGHVVWAFMHFNVRAPLLLLGYLQISGLSTWHMANG